MKRTIVTLVAAAALLGASPQLAHAAIVTNTQGCNLAPAEAPYARNHVEKQYAAWPTIVVDRVRASKDYAGSGYTWRARLVSPQGNTIRDTGYLAYNGWGSAALRFNIQANSGWTVRFTNRYDRGVWSDVYCYTTFRL